MVSSNFVHLNIKKIGQVCRDRKQDLTKPYLNKLIKKGVLTEAKTVAGIPVKFGRKWKKNVVLGIRSHDTPKQIIKKK